MAAGHASLPALPPEVLIKILSFLLPDAIRALRYVILACRHTDHKILRNVANELLEDQRTWLLDRWRKIPLTTSTRWPEGPPPGIELIAEQVIGKQYVDSEEIIDDEDHWVSLTFPHRLLLRREEYADTNAMRWKAFKRADIKCEKIAFCRDRMCFPISKFEEPGTPAFTYDNDSYNTGRVDLCSNRRKNLTRMNIEVNFLPIPLSVEEARMQGVFGGHRWQFINGLCIGVHWG